MALLKPWQMLAKLNLFLFLLFILILNDVRNIARQLQRQTVTPRKSYANFVELSFFFEYEAFSFHLQAFSTLITKKHNRHVFPRSEFSIRKPSVFIQAQHFLSPSLSLALSIFPSFFRFHTLLPHSLFSSIFIQSTQNHAYIEAIQKKFLFNRVQLILCLMYVWLLDSGHIVQRPLCNILYKQH